jgi:hypothetical protein
MKKPRTYKQLQQDPRVSDWSDERNPGVFNEGLWIYLSPGWVTDEGMMTIHEDTVAACCLEVQFAEYDPDAWAYAMDPMKTCRAGLGLLPAG